MLTGGDQKDKCNVEIKYMDELKIKRYMYHKIHVQSFLVSSVSALPESLRSPSSPSLFSPFSPFVFTTLFLSLSSIFLNQNITLPAIEVQLFPHSHRNFTLAPSLNCRHFFGMLFLVGSRVHSSGLKAWNISSKVVCQCSRRFRCGVSSSNREAICG